MQTYPNFELYDLNRTLLWVGHMIRPEELEKITCCKQLDKGAVFSRFVFFYSC